ncbi:gluconokinase [Winogradskyella vincentii]|uniref:Gluconokinase n=1 Tax=Winogradskyella vincentii TaxID=2877122 RepID=A0ABS7XXG4_9FLAO|nr:gluconokinase [Winogradskyella vincentii]MCA0151775.1 gluconokinase [Winogradskyella vincentii]
MIIIVFGVSGSGKSTIAKGLSERLRLPYYDADDFHPQQNIDKMSVGKSLNDEDRLPWLLSLADNINIWSQSEGAVLACSALKEKYRALLSSNYKTDINWVLLKGTSELIKRRMDTRKGHYMTSKLLNSQFEDLEIPDYGLHVDISEHPDSIIDKIISNI